MATESKTAAEFAAAEIAAQSAEKPTPTPLTEDIPALKAEIQRLQAELTAKETKTRETLEFSLLYPGIPLDGLPQEVKEAEELPLAAAYALYERKKLLLCRQAEAINAQNVTKASGQVCHDGGEDGSFTLEEVRRMTPGQIHRHYQSVLNSLKRKPD